MRQIGLLGGVFDPIHIGHLLAAETAREQMGLDEVWFVPSHVPPLKAQQPTASPEARLEMVYRAIDFQPHFRAVEIELLREGTSYTLDTVTALQERYPDWTFSLIIGADRLNDLPAWHQIDQLASRVRFIAVNRSGEPVRVQELPEHVRSRVTMLAMPEIGISSTEIRERCRAGRSIRFLTPEKVYQFIRRERLYEA